MLHPEYDLVQVWGLGIPQVENRFVAGVVWPIDAAYRSATKLCAVVAQQGEKKNVTMPHSELLRAIIDEPSIERGLRLVCEGLRVQHATYHLAQNIGANSDLPFIRTTYPPEWVGRYLMKSYRRVDPVFKTAYGSTEPFLWSQLKNDDPEIMEFFADVEAHGIGNCGYTIPIVGNSGRRAIFSIASQDDPADWALRIESIAQTLGELALIFHGKALTEIHGGENIPSLSPREIQCLYWSTQGKDAGTISDILELSEHTVRDYLKSARLKLGCATIAQAVYEATRLGLIHP